MRALLRPPLHERQRGFADEQRAGPHNVADLDLARADHGYALEVAEALAQVLFLLQRDEDERDTLAPLLDERLRRLGRGLGEVVRRDDRNRPLGRMTRERRPKGGLGRLPVHLLDELARDLGEGVAAARELRRADRALAGAARALLAPRLRAAAGDEPAALRRCSAGALRVL